MGLVESKVLEHVEEERFGSQALASELISGAISAAEIQDIVRRAEKRVGDNEECHLHGIGLVDRCHGCRKLLSWASGALRAWPRF